MKNDIACPLCGKKNYTVYLRQRHRQIVRCLQCGLVYVNPQPSTREINRMYNEDYFASEKKRSTSSVGYYDYTMEKPLLLAYFRRKITYLKTILSGKKVLEIGSSYGYFLEEAKRAGLDVLGIDISREAASRAAKEGLPSRAVDIFQAKFPPRSFDGVVGFHLIEHISDPLAFVREIYRITKPGGIVLFSTPREGGYLRRLMGRHWLNYRHQEHLYFFSRETMTLLLKKAGYHSIRCFGDETRWYPIHFLLREAKYFFTAVWVQKVFGWAETIFGLPPLSYIQIPYPLNIMIVTAEK